MKKAPEIQGGLTHDLSTLPEPDPQRPDIVVDPGGKEEFLFCECRQIHAPGINALVGIFPPLAPGRDHKIQGPQEIRA